jgi:hypothetical protein
MYNFRNNFKCQVKKIIYVYGIVPYTYQGQKDTHFSVFRSNWTLKNTPLTNYSYY